MIFRDFRFAILLIAYTALAPCASAQNDTQTHCPPAQAMKAEQLHGRWAARFSRPPAGLPERATLVLRRHAEFSDSLAGTVNREPGLAAGTSALAGHAAQAALAGDLDEGLLLLDESSDNISITGTWNGEMQPGSCGRVYQGVWKDTSSSAAPDAADIPFTLTRLP
ncbi:MAG: hypothetical protein JWR68_3027 [Polaromonas sp.]|nr:hypothetical protein [Polaromonas sp.]